MKTLRAPRDLARAGLIAAADVTALETVAQRYPVAVTDTVAQAMQPGDSTDPIARQYLPDARELQQATDELADPIGDDAHRVLPRLIHRYPDRVLLQATLVCPVYCRFCFRRESVGAGAPLGAAELADIVAYIRAHPEIFEVIISGGDPLALSPARLSRLLQALAAIEHVQVLRLHSRVPVAAPERIDEELLTALRSVECAVYVVVHANHAREFVPAARAAVARLADRGVALRSQTVLLAGVNDDEAALGELMRTFVALRISPYYLHHPDLAPGTGHFRVSVQRGRQLMKALRGRYSGLCQPTYVLDLPGGHGKVPLSPAYVTEQPDHLQLEDYRGVLHDYSDGIMSNE